jgi:hypothetical protein
VFVAILAEESGSDAALSGVAAAADGEETRMEGIAVRENLAVEFRGEDKCELLLAVAEHGEITEAAMELPHAGDGVF